MPDVDAETQSFLERGINLVLATSRRDDSPQLSPVWYLWKDGEFVISTNTTTAKWWNLKRDPRCSVCVDDPEELRLVVAYGRAELDEGDPWEATWELVAKYRDPEDIQAHMDRAFTGQTSVLIRLRPDKLITRKLQGITISDSLLGLK